MPVFSKDCTEAEKLAVKGDILLDANGFNPILFPDNFYMIKKV